jgi:phospholipid/cholesterol/gamma-HCH transport system substrate-binding protein
MTGEHTFRHRVAVGLVALAIVATGVTFGIKTALGTYADNYPLLASFDRTGHNLDTFSMVKIRGVNVGEVEKIALQPDGRAEVTMEIRDGIRIPDTAVASIEPLSVFGPQFIRLDPGEHEGTGPYFRPGDRISQTHPAIEITDILTSASALLDNVDTGDLVTVIHTLAEGLGGLGPVMGRTLDNGGRLVDLLDRHRAEQSRLLTDVAKLANDLAPKAGAMVATARNFNEFLPDFNARADRFGPLLDTSARLAAEVADFVNRHHPAIGKTIDGFARVVGALYRQLAAIPEFQRALKEFFYTVGYVLMREEAPDGEHIIGVGEFINRMDLCDLMTGMACPGSGTRP